MRKKIRTEHSRWFFPACSSLGCEDPLTGPPRSDRDDQGRRTLRAVPCVGRSIRAAIQSAVDIATAKENADVGSRRLARLRRPLFGRFEFVCHRFNTSNTVYLKVR